MAQQETRFWQIFTRTRNWYGKFERPISSLSLLGGFVFDAFTLTRVDMFWENFWVIIHLVVVAVAIALINKYENQGSDEDNPQKIHFWLVNVLQFFFGGLLSVFLVFYFRSGTLSISWPFFIILAAAFIANERLKRYYARLSFQVALFFLSLYLFAIYFLPVLFHTIGPWIFLFSGAVSLAILFIFLRIVRRVNRDKFMKKRSLLVALIAGIVISMNALYFTNIIPPIPLAVKAGDIYHSLVPLAPGKYVVTYEEKSWLQNAFAFFGFNNVRIIAGDTLYAYTTIFSPALFDTSVIHEWQRYDTTAHSWITRGKITLDIRGGADGGFRTYSSLPGVDPGDWRVNVETSRGEVIGRLAFTVITNDTEPPLITAPLN
jgi:hypothetical protein